MSGDGFDHLIGDVERLGAPEAAWRFFVAQAEYPDIVLYSSADFSEQSRASFARDERAKAHRAGNPVALKEEPVAPVPRKHEPEATREEYHELKAELDARDVGPTIHESDDETVDQADHDDDAEDMYLSAPSEIEIAAITDADESALDDDDEPDTSRRPLADEEYPADLRAWAEHGPYAVATKLLHNKATDDRLTAFGRLEAVKLLKRARKIGGDTCDFDAIGKIVKLCTE